MRIVRPFLLVWLALMLLLAATLGSSFVLTGPFSLATSLTIAFAKTALIYWFFMHLNEERGLSRLTALAAFGWLVILFLFVLLDYASR